MYNMHGDILGSWWETFSSLLSILAQGVIALNFIKYKKGLIRENKRNGRREEKKENDNINPETFSIDSLNTWWISLWLSHAWISCTLTLFISYWQLLTPSYVLPPLLSLPPLAFKCYLLKSRYPIWEKACYSKKHFGTVFLEYRTPKGYSVMKSCPERQQVGSVGKGACSRSLGTWVQ